MNLDYQTLAELNKPKDVKGIRAAAQELACNGLSDYDVAYALRLDVNSVRQILGRCGDCE